MMHHMAALDRNGNHVGREGSDAFAPRRRDAWIDEPVCAVRAKIPGQTLGLPKFLWRESGREGGLVAQIMQPGGHRSRICASLKTELVRQKVYKTRQNARQDLSV